MTECIVLLLIATAWMELEECAAQILQDARH